MRAFKKSNGYFPNEFFNYGMDHCQAGIDLFATNKPQYFDSAGHLIHLGLEQILKAWHLEAFAQFEDTHNLTKLIDQLGNRIIIAKIYNNALKEINSYEEIKYPKTKEPISVGNSTLKRNVAFINYIVKQMPDNLKYKDDNKYVRKGGRILVRIPVKRKNNN